MMGFRKDILEDCMYFFFFRHLTSLVFDLFYSATILNDRIKRSRVFTWLITLLDKKMLLSFHIKLNILNADFSEGRKTGEPEKN